MGKDGGPGVWYVVVGEGFGFEWNSTACGLSKSGCLSLCFAVQSAKCHQYQYLKNVLCTCIDKSCLYVCLKYFNINVLICNFETIGKMYSCFEAFFFYLEFKADVKFATPPLFHRGKEGIQGTIPFLL